jgi:hypothetical protein
MPDAERRWADLRLSWPDPSDDADQLATAASFVDTARPQSESLPGIALPALPGSSNHRPALRIFGTTGGPSRPGYLIFSPGAGEVGCTWKSRAAGRRRPSTRPRLAKAEPSSRSFPPPTPSEPAGQRRSEKTHRPHPTDHRLKYAASCSSRLDAVGAPIDPSASLTRQAFTGLIGE